MLIGAVATLGLTACKKDYTCECDGYDYTILESTMKSAKNYCEGPKELRGLGEIADEDGENGEHWNNECELSKF